jgi:hypothetical protein
VNQVILEHLVMHADADGRLVLRTSLAPLPPMADPVQAAAAAFPGTFTHSTSWRWSPDGVILTFAHVRPDDSAEAAGADAASTDAMSPAAAYTAVELEHLPVSCHAVRHLHFLVRTDEDVAAIPGYDRFWALAAEVADHHYPAVAGLLPDAPEYQI